MKRIKSIVVFVIIFCFVGCISAPIANAQHSSKDSIYEYKPASSGGLGKFYMGREIAYVMGASNSSWLDRNSRPQEENTQLAIDKIKLPRNGVVADIGAGTGYYTFKLAPKVPEGKVYAVELQNEMIDALNERKKKL